jgi:hypothetical protein
MQIPGKLSLTQSSQPMSSILIGLLSDENDLTIIAATSVITSWLTHNEGGEHDTGHVG